MSAANEFDIKIQAPGIDIHRKVNESVGRRIVSILIGGGDAGAVADDADGEPDSAAKSKSPQSKASTTREGFFEALKNGKPSENALAAAAYYYSQYGSAEFSVDEMRDLADDVGVTVPERLDMTYLSATREGNRLFRRGGRGAFRPTVHGEAFFKQTYNVRKGTSQKPGGAVL